MSDPTRSAPPGWLAFAASVALGAAPGLFAVGRYSGAVDDLREQVAELRAWKESTRETLAEMKTDAKATRQGVEALQGAFMSAGVRSMVPSTTASK